MEKSIKMQEKMIMVAYEVPMVEVIEVEVEKGFAASYDFGTNPVEHDPSPWN